MPATPSAESQRTENARTSAEDDVTELPTLIAPLMDFVASASRTKVARAWVGENIDGLVQAAARWAQMTPENEEDWAADANLFVAQEDDETVAYSVRVAVFDLLGVSIACSLISRAGADENLVVARDVPCSSSPRTRCRS